METVAITRAVAAALSDGGRIIFIWHACVGSRVCRLRGNSLMTVVFTLHHQHYPVVYDRGGDLAAVNEPVRDYQPRSYL